MRKCLITSEEINERCKPSESPGMFEMLPDWLTATKIETESSVTGIKNSLASKYHVHFVNKGFWNMHELLPLLLEHTGPANVTISTYAVSETAARTLALLMDQKQILSLTAIIDNRVDTRSAGSLQLLRSICDKISLVSCHAKVTLLHNDHHDMVIIGSANYTENKRYEVGFISQCGEAFKFHNSWITDAINEHGQYNP